MQTIADAMFNALRRMDEEAYCTKEDYPTGLAWYGGYFQPECKRPSTETSWTRRLAQLLPEHGFPTKREVRYPYDPALKCDNVITLPGGGKLWLEIKGAWKDYWITHNGEGIYRSYLLDPLVTGLDAKTHTAPLDLRKLYPLARPHAEFIGFLLLGFDSTKTPMDDDVEELKRLAGLDKRPWTQHNDGWLDRYRPGCRVMAWLWQRPVL